MNWKIRACAAWAASWTFFCDVAHAETCAPPITRANVAPCGVARSLATKAERHQAEAIEGRWKATNPIFPSNPVLSVTGSRRFATAASDLVTYNWYAALSQEIEIAGQRGARRRVVGSERVAQTQAIVVSERDAAAEAWDAYFDALAAKEDLELVKRLESLSKRMADAVSAAADKGLASGVDADTADASLLRITQIRVGAILRARQSASALATRLGIDPTAPLAIEGDLEPIAAVANAIAADIEHRPEVLALEARAHATSSQADYFRRARFPNVTLSVFAGNDEVNQPIVGFGVSLPIVFPQPIGRTYEGEIAESEALSRRLLTEADAARREVTRELAVAREAYDTSMQGRALYTEQRLTRAEKSLQSIASEIEAGRLAVRDAVLAQQTLTDMLRASIEAKHALCVASVALAKAAGLALERGVS